MSLSNFVKRIRNIMRNDAGINGDAQRIEQMAWMLFLKVYDEKENDWEMEDDYKSIIPEECRWRNWAHDDGSGHALTGDDLLSFVNNVVFDKLKKIEITPDTPIRQAIVRTVFEDANQYMKDGVQLRQVLNVIDDLNLADYEESHAFGEIYENILKEMQSAGSSGEFYTPRALTEFMAEIIKPQIGEKMADFACGTGGFITSWLGELDKRVVTAEDREKFNQSVFGIEKKQFPYMLCVTNLLLHGIDKPLVFHDNSLTKDVLNYTEEDQFDIVLMNPPYGGNEKADVKSHFPSDMRSSETADLFMVLIMYRLKKNGRAAVIVPDGSCLVQIIPRLLSKQNCCETSICILLSDCLVVFSHHIPLSQPTFCSSIMKRQKIHLSVTLPKRHGSIVWICRRDTSISPKQNRCVWSIVILSKNGGITVRKSLLRKETRKPAAIQSKT